MFDQMPVKAAAGLIPRKTGLDTEKYGGYNKSTATAFLLVKYKEKGKQEAMIMPVDYMYSEKVFSDEEYALKYSKENIQNIWGRTEEQITDVSLPLGLRPIKINTMLSFDGFKACITGKSGGGKQLGMTSMMSLVVGYKWELYIKKLESYKLKKEKNKSIVLNEAYDEICSEKNEELYDILVNKVTNGIYSLPFDAQKDKLKDGIAKFSKLSLDGQVEFLMQFILLLKAGRSGYCDMSAVGGSKQAGVFVINPKMSAWIKKYNKVSIIDISSSGIYQNESENLLDIIK